MKGARDREAPQHGSWAEGAMRGGQQRDTAASKTRPGGEATRASIRPPPHLPSSCRGFPLAERSLKLDNRGRRLLLPCTEIGLLEQRRDEMNLRGKQPTEYAHT